MNQKVVEASLLKQTLKQTVNLKILNTKDIINSLKKVFVPFYYNKEYLEYWFYFLKVEFLRKAIHVQTEEWQWLWDNLQNFKKVIDNKQNPNFTQFKIETEKKFPWSQTIKLKLQEISIFDYITRLKQMFTPFYYKEYLEYWFHLLEVEFLKKENDVQEKECKWLWDNLTKFKNMIYNKQQLNFPQFRKETETYFPWSAEIENKLLRFRAVSYLKFLKKIFISSYNEPYLTCWFDFFEKNFLKTDIENQKIQCKWLRDSLNRFKQMIKNKEEPDFLYFKFKTETRFPWDEQVEFDFLENSLLLKPIAIDLLHEKQAAIKNELSGKLNNEKEELNQDLLRSNEQQNKILNCYNIIFKNISILEKTQKSYFFKLKNKIVNFFTFGFFSLKKKLENKIMLEKNNLVIEKKRLYEIGLKICSLKEDLEKIQKTICKKNQQIYLFEQERSSIQEITNTQSINLTDVENYNHTNDYEKKQNHYICM